MWVSTPRATPPRDETTTRRDGNILLNAMSPSRAPDRVVDVRPRRRRRREIVVARSYRDNLVARIFLGARDDACERLSTIDYRRRRAMTASIVDNLVDSRR
jgi:hypothetical protein